MRLFGSKKAAPVPAAPESSRETEDVADHRFDKEIEIYPGAVRLLWHFYQPADVGKPEGTPKELQGPIDEPTADGAKELEKIGLIEIVPGFGDFGITAKLTQLGLQVMDGQTERGHLSEVSMTNPVTRAVTIYKEVHLGY